MVLRFLMFGLDKSVLTSLQNLPIECKSSKCHFGISDRPLSTNFNGVITKVDTRFHNCVCIKNETTGKRNILDVSDVTIWESENDDNLGSLFIAFLEFYLVKKAYKSISIIFEDGNLVGLSKHEALRDTVFVQDPFLFKKNIA